jgi:XTP/dITP diphosphohydrolase
MIRFISGNEHKASELREAIAGLAQADIDLPEIQSVDSRAVIAAKLLAAREKIREGAILVEDTALHLACLNGFPGALIKWMLESVGCEGIHRLCAAVGDCGAEARTVLGYLPEGSEEPQFFDDTLLGTICAPRGRNGFGWDPIFVPKGLEKSLAEMTEEELRSIKMRRRAAEKLVRFLGESSV